MKWRRTATGDYLSEDGCWKIRTIKMLASMYWLYQLKNGRSVGRYTPTGRYDDSVHFSTLKEAKDFVKHLTK